MKNSFKLHQYRILQIDNDIILSIEKDNLVLDIQKLLPILNSHTKQDKQSIQEYNVFITFYGYILTGGSESTNPYNECFFGELDSKDSNLGLDTLKPIYHLIGEVDSNSIESKTNNTESNNSLSTLNIFFR